MSPRRNRRHHTKIRGYSGIDGSYRPLEFIPEEGFPPLEFSSDGEPVIGSMSPALPRRRRLPKRIDSASQEDVIKFIQMLPDRV